MPEEIDYDALAAKHGAAKVAPETIDYDAIAAKHGGAPVLAESLLNRPAGRISPELQPSARDIGTAALESLPYVGATAATLLFPEAVSAGWLVRAGLGAAKAGLGAGAGSIAERGLKAATGQPQPTTNVAEDMLYKGALPELGGRALTGTLTRIFRPFFSPRRLYQSGLKPTGDLAEAEKAVQAGIRERIPLTEAAPGLARRRVDSLNQQIERVIESTPASVSPDKYVANVTSRLDGLRSRWGMDATHGKEFVGQINQFERDFLIQHGNPQPVMRTTKKGLVEIAPEDMTLAELRAQSQPISSGNAQAIKKQTYETIRTSNEGAWDKGTHPGLSVRVNQEIAQAMRQELEVIYPNLRALNRREGDLIALEEQLARFVKREGNKQITPYFVFPAAGAAFGGAVAGAEGAAGGAGVGMVAAHLMRSALEDPAIKSRLAIVLDRAAHTVAGRATRAVAPHVPTGAIRLGEWALREDNLPKSVNQLQIGTEGGQR